MLWGWGAGALSNGGFITCSTVTGFSPHLGRRDCRIDCRILRVLNTDASVSDEFDLNTAATVTSVMVRLWVGNNIHNLRSKIVNHTEKEWSYSWENASMEDFLDWFSGICMHLYVYCLTRLLSEMLWLNLSTIVWIPCLSAMSKPEWFPRIHVKTTCVFCIVTEAKPDRGQVAQRTEHHRIRCVSVYHSKHGFQGCKVYVCAKRHSKATDRLGATNARLWNGDMQKCFQGCAD